VGLEGEIALQSIVEKTEKPPIRGWLIFFAILFVLGALLHAYNLIANSVNLYHFIHLRGSFLPRYINIYHIYFVRYLGRMSYDLFQFWLPLLFWYCSLVEEKQLFGGSLI
jgi:hypothetical protein